MNSAQTSTQTNTPCSAKVGVDKAWDAILQIEERPRQAVFVTKATVTKAKVKQNALTGPVEIRGRGGDVSEYAAEKNTEHCAGQDSLTLPGLL
jgi:hypothetical protein